MGATVQKKTYSVIITKDDDGGFVGRCDELHANSEGETFGETVENMREAVGCAAEERGDVADFTMLVTEQ